MKEHQRRRFDRRRAETSCTCPQGADYDTACATIRIGCPAHDPERGKQMKTSDPLTVRMGLIADRPIVDLTALARSDGTIATLKRSRAVATHEAIRIVAEVGFAILPVSTLNNRFFNPSRVWNHAGFIVALI